MDVTRDLVCYELPSVCSQLDVEMFRAWNKTLYYNWDQAVVDRNKGLTLFSENLSGFATALHFSNALCGYCGEGPGATVTILVEAGFGPREHLEAVIFSEMQAEFTK